MPRTKGGYKTRQRRNRVLKMAQGYWGARRKLYALRVKQLTARSRMHSLVESSRSVSFVLSGFSASTPLFGLSA